MKTITAYHGTNSRFNKFEQSKARVVNDVFGGGVAYFTDSVDIAKGYANNMARAKGGDKILYEVVLKFNKLFDTDEMYTGNELQKMIGTDVESFARGASLLKLGADRTDVLAKLRGGKMSLTGEQVFKGMSNGMISTRRARERLIQLGYDGLRHNGGLMGGSRHNVYLSYRADQIQIVKRYIITPKPVRTEEQSDVYHFIN